MSSAWLRRERRQGGLSSRQQRKRVKQLRRVQKHEAAKKEEIRARKKQARSNR